MRIHAVQTGTVTVKAGQQQGSRGRGYLRLINTLLADQWTAPLPIYAWVMEHPEGVIVVDTGDTARTSEPGYFPTWHPYYRWGVQFFIEPEEEIGLQLQAINISPSDVRWVVMTHLHTDHAGGLHHFPKAEILVSRTEYKTAAGLMGRLNGFLPHRWPAWLSPMLIDFAPVSYGPFPQCFTLTKKGDVHLVPTPGHSRGHLSVVLQEDNLTYFFAGDTSYTQQLMLDGTVDGVSLNYGAAQQTLMNIQRFVQQQPTVYLPSHDPNAAARLTTRQTVPMLAKVTHAGHL